MGSKLGGGAGIIVEDSVGNYIAAGAIGVGCLDKDFSFGLGGAGILYFNSLLNVGLTAATGSGAAYLNLKSTKGAVGGNVNYVSIDLPADFKFGTVNANAAGDIKIDSVTSIATAASITGLRSETPAGKALVGTGAGVANICFDNKNKINIAAVAARWYISC
jgi:hypothetical protein